MQGMMGGGAEGAPNAEDMQQRLFDGINGMKTKIEEVND